MVIPVTPAGFTSTALALPRATSSATTGADTRVRCLPAFISSFLGSWRSWVGSGDLASLQVLVEALRLALNANLLDQSGQLLGGPCQDAVSITNLSQCVWPEFFRRDPRLGIHPPRPQVLQLKWRQ